jgi:hypothetical protein
MVDLYCAIYTAPPSPRTWQRPPTGTRRLELEERREAPGDEAGRQGTLLIGGATTGFAQSGLYGNSSSGSGLNRRSLLTYARPFFCSPSIQLASPASCIGSYIKAGVTRKKVEAAHGSFLIITNERINRWINSKESPSGRRDGSHQRRGVDLIGHGGLCHIDDCEEQELRVVEDRETLHLGGGKGE